MMIPFFCILTHGVHVEGNFSFIELDRLCNSLEAKVFQLILAVLREFVL